MVEYHSTPPILKSFVLLSSGTRDRLLSHIVPFPGCLSFPPLATLGLLDTVLAISMLLHVHALHLSDLHLPSRSITSSEMYPPAATAVASPIRNACNANSSRLRRDLTTTSLTAQGARPYLTTLTELSNRLYLMTLMELSNRHEARGA